MTETLPVREFARNAYPAFPHDAKTRVELETFSVAKLEAADKRSVTDFSKPASSVASST